MGEYLKKINPEIGMYNEAANKGLSFSTWLEDYHVVQGYDPTIYKGLSNSERVALKKTLKAQGKEVPLSAYEMLLADADIKAFGAITDTISKFFQNSSTVALFPEFMSNRVYAGAIRASLVPRLIAETVIIQGFDYRKVYLDDTEAERQTAQVGRGAEIPEAHMSVSTQLSSLKKYGRTLKFDYESVENTPLNLYGQALMQVGDQIGVDETDDVIYALINGDGNSNGLQSAQTVTTTATTVISKLDIIKFASALPAPYQLDVFVGKKAYMQVYWDTLSDMQNPAAQWGMTGMQLPVGLEWDRSVVTSDRFFGVDSRRTASYVTNDTVLMTETDRIINKQQVMTVFTKRSNIAVIEKNAIGCLDIEH